MDQADIELRTTIIKCWPHTKREKIDLLVPTPKSEYPSPISPITGATRKVLTRKVLMRKVLNIKNRA